MGNADSAVVTGTYAATKSGLSLIPEGDGRGRRGSSWQIAFGTKVAVHLKCIVTDARVMRMEEEDHDRSK